MKFFIKLSAVVIMLASTATSLGYFFWYKPKFNSKAATGSVLAKPEKEPTNNFIKLKTKAEQIKEFAKANGYNTTYSFMVDMHIPSGQKRFYVYNLLKDSLELSGLVAHGSGSDQGDRDLYFSNALNSNCTSLGKYKIGKSYYGKFGLAYKLHGLDKTNSKAFERFVVLHAHECVPDEEVYPLSICQSWGCPTVAPAFLESLKKFISRSEKPILMNIYY